MCFGAPVITIMLLLCFRAVFHNAKSLNVATLSYGNFQLRHVFMNGEETPANHIKWPEGA